METANMANLIGAYAAGINRVLKDKLKFDSDAPYVVHAPLWMKWAWKDFANKYVNVGESLRRAMHANPHMMFAALGWFQVANRHTFSYLFQRNLAARETVDRHRVLVTEIVDHFVGIDAQTRKSRADGLGKATRPKKVQSLTPVTRS